MEQQEIGKRIRELREAKAMSREEFCQGEMMLSARHLERIEKGEVCPTLDKLSFVAKRLTIPLVDLIDSQKKDLPKEYLILKEKIFRSQGAHQNAERADEKELWFDEIYEKFFDDLPAEEQLTIELKQTSLDIQMSKDVGFAQGIIDEYIEDLKQKSLYKINDFLTAQIYFFFVHQREYEQAVFDNILQKTIDGISYSSDLELLALESALTTAAGFYIQEKRYKELPVIYEASEKIYERNFRTTLKPIWLLLEAKYLLFVENNFETAENRYDEAAQLAKLQGNIVVEKNIKMDKELDKKSIELFNCQ